MDTTQDEVIRAGELEIRPGEYLALAGGRVLALSVREVQLLAALARRSGRIVPRDELYATVWGSELRTQDRSVDVYVHKLRAKLARALPEWRFIHTHFGFGYRFEAEPSTHFSQDGHRRVTGLRPDPVSLAAERTREKGHPRMKHNRFLLTLAVSGALAFGVVACGDEEEPAAGGGQAQQEESGGDTQNLSGAIAIDGSSTVQPFAEAAAELFQEEAPNVRITVGGSGTGDGFERFCEGEIQISDASRPIEDDERQACEQGGVEFSEVQVANDGLAVITHPETQIDCFTTAQLKRLLRPKSNIDNYSQLGGDFPDQPVTFFTPGEESGTFDYITEVILETDAEQRTEDVQTSANDNQLLTGVEGTQGALGYLGFSYVQDAGDKVNVVGIDGGGRLRGALARDGAERDLQAPRAADLHVSEPGGPQAARGQGVHGLHAREPAADRRGGEDRADD